ncbi:hypothetical protein HYX00_05340 [Candidatus Woesearchaeota archaeon]|nr:hypothetical protein [Candidatus Woesearchaeota archaeon]
MSNVEIVQMLIKGQNDLEWFYSNLDRFKSEYNDMFVAFSNQEIIDTDSVLDNLISKLRKKGFDISTIFIEFVTKTKFIL